MEEKTCNEKRAALIAALIAIPSALLISMVIHHFVPVEEDFPRFTSEEATGPAPAPVKRKRPRAPMPPPAPGMNKGAKAPGTPAGKLPLLTLAGKRAETADRNLKLAQALYKAKKLGMDELLLLTEKSLLAQGALYRLENKIRSFRSSISDLAVRHETAKQRWALAKGRGTSLAAGKLEYEVLDLAFQLQSSRIYSNPLWKSAFDAYCKAPGKASYLAMLKAEAEAAPRRRF